MTVHCSLGGPLIPMLIVVIVGRWVYAAVAFPTPRQWHGHTPHVKERCLLVCHQRHLYIPQEDRSCRGGFSGSPDADCAPQQNRIIIRAIGHDHVRQNISGLCSTSSIWPGRDCRHGDVLTIMPNKFRLSSPNIRTGLSYSSVAVNA